MPPPPRRNHARHSGLTIRTMLEAFRKAVRRRSSIEIRFSPRAARRAFLTVVMDTPATSATSLLVRRQSLRLRCSAAITARTACSAKVNRLARAGGRAPEAAQRRRRSSDAGCSEAAIQTAAVQNHEFCAVQDAASLTIVRPVSDCAGHVPFLPLIDALVARLIRVSGRMRAEGGEETMTV